MTATNQNLIQEEMKRGMKRELNSGNACYCSVQNLLSSCLLSKNLKIGDGSLTLREEHRLRVFENRVLRRIFGPKRDGVMGESRKLHNEELCDLCPLPCIIRIIKSRTMKWGGVM
jgi:hypothetical protein